MPSCAPAPAKTEDAAVKEQLSNFKVYKTSEGAAGGNALYVILFDPAAKDASTSSSQLVQKVMTPDELRAPETQRDGSRRPPAPSRPATTS